MHRKALHRTSAPPPVEETAGHCRGSLWHSSFRQRQRRRCFCNRSDPPEHSISVVLQRPRSLGTFPFDNRMHGTTMLVPRHSTVAAVEPTHFITVEVLLVCGNELRKSRILEKH